MRSIRGRCRTSLWFSRCAIERLGATPSGLLIEAAADSVRRSGIRPCLFLSLLWPRCSACRTPKELWPAVENVRSRSMKRARTAWTPVRSPAAAGMVDLRRTFRPEVLYRISTQAHPSPNAILDNRLLLLLAEVRQLLEDTHENRFSAPSGRHVCPRIGPGRWLRRRKDSDRTGCAARAHGLDHEGACHPAGVDAGPAGVAWRPCVLPKSIPRSAASSSVGGRSRARRRAQARACSGSIKLLSRQKSIRQPDVQQAEQVLIAANADIGAARAAFFPWLSLTASLGYTSSPATGSLFDGAQRAGRFAQQLSVALFSAGPLRFELRLPSYASPALWWRTSARSRQPSEKWPTV